MSLYEAVFISVVVENLRHWTWQEPQYLSRIASYRVQTSQERQMYAVSSKAGGLETSKLFEIKVPVTGYEAIGFGACFAGFQSCFGLLFPH